MNHRVGPHQMQNLPAPYLDFSAFMKVSNKFLLFISYPVYVQYFVVAVSKDYDVPHLANCNSVLQMRFWEMFLAFPPPC
jgi:hypothetical protein